MHPAPHKGWRKDEITAEDDRGYFSQGGQGRPFCGHGEGGDQAKL